MIKFIILLFTTVLFSCSSSTSSVSTADDNDDTEDSSSLSHVDPKSSSTAETKSIDVEESGKYTTRDSVATYLCKFGKLPSNYVNKNDGMNLYENVTGNTFSKWNFNPWITIGVMIGGDVFENREERLPPGSYHEADVNYNASNRGTRRLVYSNPCTIYYTADHYENFQQLSF